MTLLAKQLDWVADEMDYSRSKDGYDVKLARFRVSPEADDSVMNHMGSYWHRFNLSHSMMAGLDGQPEADSALVQLATRSLVYLGKTAAGMADKVGLSLWLQHDCQDPPTSQVLGLIHQAVAADLSRNPACMYFGRLGDGEPFEATDMGVRILAMHSTIQNPAPDSPRFSAYGSRAETLRHLSLEATVRSLSAWQTYIRKLDGYGIRPDLPRPAIPGGGVKTWDSDSARIWPAG